MEAQTYSVMVAMGSRESIDLVVALLEESVAVEELSKRTGVASATTSRRLRELALTGVISRLRPRDPFSITCPEETQRFLEAASDLSLAIIRERESGERELQRRIQGRGKLKSEAA